MHACVCVCVCVVRVCIQNVKEEGMCQQCEGVRVWGCVPLHVVLRNPNP